MANEKHACANSSCTTKNSRNLGIFCSVAHCYDCCEQPVKPGVPCFGAFANGRTDVSDVSDSRSLGRLLMHESHFSVHTIFAEYRCTVLLCTSSSMLNTGALYCCATQWHILQSQLQSQWSLDGSMHQGWSNTVPKGAPADATKFSRDLPIPGHIGIQYEVSTVRSLKHLVVTQKLPVLTLPKVESRPEFCQDHESGLRSDQGSSYYSIYR
jgi:hypothetical protein